MAYDKKRLDTLIRQGLMPAKQLPILHRGLEKLKKGQVPNPYEREAISKLLDKTMGFQFGDDITYNRARLHTQRTRYQTEGQDMVNEEDVIVYDGSKDEAESKRDEKVKKKAKSKNLKTKKGDDMEPEDIKEASASDKAAARPADKGQEEGDKESPKQGGSKVPEVGELCDAQDSKPNIKEGLIADLDSEGKRERATRLSRKKGKISKEKLAKQLPAALRKEKQKAGLSEDLAKFNELYKENLDRALANNKVDNVRDIPEKIKADLFKHVEEATYSNKQIRMAKGIAFDKRHKGGDMTGAYKKMEKIKKGLGDTPEASKALRQANEEKMATKDHDGDGKVETGKQEYFGSRDKAIKKAMKKKSFKESYREVLEGAKEDAMRDMRSPGATKGMAKVKSGGEWNKSHHNRSGMPNKKSKHDGSENKGPEHIVAQLRKAISLGDKHDGVKFQDGKTHKVKAHHAQKFLNKYMSGKPAEKEKMQSHGHASHENFKKHLD